MDRLCGLAGGVLGACTQGNCIYGSLVVAGLLGSRLERSLPCPGCPGGDIVVQARSVLYRSWYNWLCRLNIGTLGCLESPGWQTPQ